MYCYRLLLTNNFCRIPSFFIDTYVRSKDTTVYDNILKPKLFVALNSEFVENWNISMSALIKYKAGETGTLPIIEEQSSKKLITT